MLILSYLYYFTFSVKASLFMVFATVTIYAGGIWLESIQKKADAYLAVNKAVITKDEKKAYKEKIKKNKRWVLLLIILLDFGMLAIVKYTDFAIENINVLLGKFGAEPFGLMNLGLPLGISFFTFQLMSYVFDVYYGTAKVQKNILYVGLYVSMFPQLIAGPIVRYETVADEIVNRVENRKDFAEGFGRFVVGLGKKILISNYVGKIADIAFATEGGMSVAMAWLGAIAYTLQIYFDFSGYSDMAIGLGRMFGFRFKENFAYPYTSLSIQEFWRRWHITLSTWFRDYVYIPLGGNRVSKGRHIWNIFVVWFLTGVWHGANWTFICWGLLYFVLLMFEKLTGFHKKNGWYMHIYTMFFVILGWVLFRADSITAAGQYIGNMFGAGATGFIDATFIDCVKNSAVIFAAAVIFSFPVVSKVGELLEKKPMFKNVLASVCMVVVFIASILICIKATYNPFIYLNF